MGSDPNAKMVISMLEKRNDSDAEFYVGHARYKAGIRPLENKSDTQLREDGQNELFRPCARHRSVGQEGKCDVERDSEESALAG